MRLPPSTGTAAVSMSKVMSSLTQLVQGRFWEEGGRAELGRGGQAGGQASLGSGGRAGMCLLSHSEAHRGHWQLPLANLG